MIELNRHKYRANGIVIFLVFRNDHVIHHPGVCGAVIDRQRLGQHIKMQKVSILWFRNGLRIHDNGSLIKATEKGQVRLCAVHIPV